MWIVGEMNVLRDEVHLLYATIILLGVFYKLQNLL